MCGICRVVRCVTGCGNRRSNGCGCGYGTERRANWSEPRMRVTCASGLGTRSGYPCVSDDDCDCVRNRRRSCGCEYDYDDYSCRDCD